MSHSHSMKTLNDLPASVTIMRSEAACLQAWCYMQHSIAWMLQRAAGTANLLTMHVGKVVLDAALY